MLNVAAAAGLLGSVFLYHRAYDHLMMFPLLFVALAATGRRPSAWNLGVAAALGLSLWVPEKLIQDLPLAWLLRPATWTACGAALVLSHLRAVSPRPCSPRPETTA